MSEILFPVEASHVLAFARAIGDPNPVYRDADAARSAGLAGVIAPPTFGIAADHFDPDFERRPRPGVPWFGSGREAVSVHGGSQQASGGGSGFHAEEHFRYHRPLRVGDRLTGRRRPGATWHKRGRRGGELTFIEEVTEYRDEAGAPVLTMRWVSVLTERPVGLDGGEEREEGGDAGVAPASGAAAPGAAAAPRAADADPAGWAPEAGVGSVELRGRRLRVGDVVETTLVEDLKRTQIVMYAGASGDFHPMHTDEPYAKAMGMPGVFAHGMLTMGITGRALTDLAGDGVLADYRGRFAAQVWPGDSLRARVTVEGVDRCRERRAVRLAVVTLDQRGQAVLTGGAHAWLGD